jgi:hypothetical protein
MVDNSGLSQEYEKNSDNSTFLKYFFGLPFLKPDEAEDCFTDDIVSILPEDEKV